ncbi:MAG TPA: PfkB family carbohydrate kinase [Gaiellaceae bacterium]|nr:PfkB family carbohydrate kinase [Gaiellaceae bacterium]
MLDFLAVGDVMLDVRLPAAAPGTRLHTQVSVGAGGSAVNAARAAARLGARAAVVGTVGNDPIGRAIADELAAAGIEAHLAVADVPTGTTVYTGDAVVADRGANAKAAVSELPAARVTLVSAYLPADARTAALAAAHGLRALDLQGVLDDAPGAGVVLGPNLDLDTFVGGRRVVCSTLAAGGAEAIADGVRARVRPSRVLAESPAGAGDAFAAGFLLALAAGLPLEECLRRGCDSAVP